MLSLWLVGEKKDSYIEQWILTTMTPEVEQDIGKAALTWRASLWRDLICAELTLMNRQARSADPVIERFFHLLTLRKEKVNEPGNLSFKMSAWPATSELAQVLKNRPLPGTSPTLFSKFAKFLRRISGKGDQPYLIYCRLLLVHPASPDPYPFLDYCRAKAGPQGSPVMDHQMVTTKYLRTFTQDVERMYQLLEDQGDVVNAKWAADLRQNCDRDAAQLWRDSESKFYRDGRPKHVLEGYSKIYSKGNPFQ